MTPLEPEDAAAIALIIVLMGLAIALIMGLHTEEQQIEHEAVQRIEENLLAGGCGIPGCQTEGHQPPPDATETQHKAFIEERRARRKKKPEKPPEKGETQCHQQ